ncbi:MAG: hypothetical protein ACW96U_08665 [Candidatus Heimdallarchaeaceae archaeon]
MVTVTSLSKAKITWEVFKTGGIVFVISAIAPFIHTMFFIKNSLPIEYVYNGYGEWQFVIDLFFLISNWLLCVVPLTIPVILSKILVYTKYSKWARYTPILSFLLILILAICAPIVYGVYA